MTHSHFLKSISSLRHTEPNLRAANVRTMNCRFSSLIYSPLHTIRFYDKRYGSVQRAGLPHIIRQFKSLKIPSSLTSGRRHRHTFFTCVHVRARRQFLSICVFAFLMRIFRTRTLRASQTTMPQLINFPKRLNIFVVSRCFVGIGRETLFVFAFGNSMFIVSS
jgi:hypothetical protein